MRIVYTIPALYNSGGMERVLSCKANYLASLNWEVHIITTDQMGRPSFFALHPSIRTYDLGINYEETNGGAFWHKVKGHIGRERRHRARLERLLYDIKPRIVISMFGHDASFLPLIKDGSAKLLEYHFCKLKRLQYGRRGLWRLMDVWRTRQDKRDVARFDEFIVLTEEDKALWGSVHPRVQVIPNPLPFSSSEVSPLTTKRIIAAGRYSHQKNFEALIRIWSRIASKYPDWHLSIYGDGAMRSELQRLVDTLGLGTSLTLECPTSDMPSVYMDSAIYAMTSRYEGLPMVLIEAQTIGLPIVSYACQCGPRDIITDGVDGFIVEMDDEEQFAERLATLIEDDVLRHKMGECALQASRRYQIEPIMSQWLDLLSKYK